MHVFIKKGIPTLIFSLLSAVVFLPLANSQEKKPVPPMAEWEQGIRKTMEKDEKLKALAAKYPLVLLHSRYLYAGGAYKESAYSFIYESFDEKKHFCDVQFLWGNSRDINNKFAIHMQSGQQNLVADLGKVDFEKNLEIGRINIDDPHLGRFGIAVEGHVYLERVRDIHGCDFYVLFQVVAVDKESRWRKLPGGKIVKRFEKLK